MTPTALAFLFVVLALGAFSCFLGLRGRRISRAPVCRNCRFDLTGVYPDGRTCPECGAGLARPNAVRIGQRQRMWPLAALGAVLVCLPASILGLAVYTLLTGASLAAYMPVPMLLSQARHGSQEAIRDAGGELLSRLNADKLSEHQRRSVIDAILEQQADKDAQWDESLGDFIETVRIDGTIDDQTYQRFLNHAIVLRFETRPTVAVGDPVPIRMVRVEDRVGSGSRVRVRVRVGEIRLGDTLLDMVPGSQPDAPPRERVESSAGFSPTFTAWGSACGITGGGVEQHFARIGDRPLPVGQHSFSVPYTLEGHPYISGQPFVGRADSNTAADATAILELQVVPVGNRELRLIPASENIQRRMVQEIGVRVSSESRGPSRGMVYIIFDLSRLSMPLAHDVFLAYGDTELQVGSVEQVAASELLPSFLSNRGIGTGVPIPETGTVSVILRPNPDRAVGLVDMDELYDGVVVFKAVEVQRR